MARRSTLALAVAAASALALGARASATEAERLTRQPAATLLLPYFEVELPKQAGAKPKGRTTVFTIASADASAMLAHVTVWSDLGVPVTAFDVYLTGYDVQTIDLAEVIEGRLPQTASAGQDPTDDVSPQGIASQDINFASCSGILPYPEQLGEDFVAHMRASLTGQASPLFGGECAGLAYDEKRPLARGYVTVDAVNACSLLFADSPGYFLSGGSGIASNLNRLWGDYAYVDRRKKSVRGGPLVAIRADSTDPESSIPGEYTFYGRHVADTAIDNRQPLATNFLGRFVNDARDPYFPGGTELFVWRDSKFPDETPFPCGTTPPWFPLVQEQIVVFDEEENPQVPVLPPVPPLPAENVIPFPAMAQKVRLGSEEFPVLFPRGFVFLNLNTVVLPATSPAEDPAAAQAFVTTSVNGRASSVTQPAVALDSAANAAHTIVPVP